MQDLSRHAGERVEMTGQYLEAKAGKGIDLGFQFVMVDYDTPTDLDSEVTLVGELTAVFVPARSPGAVATQTYQKPWSYYYYNLKNCVRCLKSQKAPMATSPTISASGSPPPASRSPVTGN